MDSFPPPPPPAQPTETLKNIAKFQFVHSPIYAPLANRQERAGGHLEVVSTRNIITNAVIDLNLWGSDDGI
jgi:hypothetical protein